MPRQKAADAGGSRILEGEERVAEFLMEVAVNVEVGAARVNENASGIVIEKKGDVHALGGDFDPLLILVTFFQFPSVGAVVVAGHFSHGRDHGVGPDSQTADFNHAE